MIKRTQADMNMGDLRMSKDEAHDYIERARKGQPVDLQTLYRATLAYRNREPRKLFIPVLSNTERMRVNAVLLWNIGLARYQQLKERHDAGHKTADEDVPSAVCQTGGSSN